MRQALMVLSFVIGVLSLPLVRAADAAVLCTNPGGQISLRNTYRPETMW